jgi:hypothetical protein
MSARSVRTISFITAGISFGLGTLILLIHFFMKGEGMLFIGFYYLVGAVAINLLVLFMMIIVMFIRPEDLKENLVSAGILLLNIPIACVYFMLAMTYLDS